MALEEPLPAFHAHHIRRRRLCLSSPSTAYYRTRIPCPAIRAETFRPNGYGQYQLVTSTCKTATSQYPMTLFCTIRVPLVRINHFPQHLKMEISIVTKCVSALQQRSVVPLVWFSSKIELDAVLSLRNTHAGQDARGEMNERRCRSVHVSYIRIEEFEPFLKPCVGHSATRTIFHFVYTTICKGLIKKGVLICGNKKSERP